MLRDKTVDYYIVGRKNKKNPKKQWNFLFRKCTK